MERNIKLKSAAVIAAMVFAVSTMLSACGADNTGAGGTEPGTLTGTVTVSGASAVQPLIQELSDTFKQTEPKLTIDIKASDSDQGIKDVSGGTSDIGASSRELTADEKNLGLTENLIAYDGVAVVVNPANTVSNLSKDQISKIFTGAITNWKDVGGPDGEILVVTREAGSGIRTSFEEKMGEITPNALAIDGEGAVKALVSSRENAISYASLGHVDDTMKKVSIDNIECSADTVKSNTYPVSAPLILLTKGEPKPETKAFIDFILGDKGQEIIVKAYVPAK